MFNNNDDIRIEEIDLSNPPATEAGTQPAPQPVAAPQPTPVVQTPTPAPATQDLPDLDFAPVPQVSTTSTKEAEAAVGGDYLSAFVSTEAVINDFPEVQAGTYRASIVGANFGGFKNGKGTRIEVDLKIEEGAFAGQRVWVHFWTSHDAENQQWKVKRHFEDLNVLFSKFNLTKSADLVALAAQIDGLKDQIVSLKIDWDAKKEFKQKDMFGVETFKEGYDATLEDHHWVEYKITPASV